MPLELVGDLSVGQDDYDGYDAHIFVTSAEVVLTQDNVLDQRDKQNVRRAAERILETIK